MLFIISASISTQNADASRMSLSNYLTLATAAKNCIAFSTKPRLCYHSGTNQVEQPYKKKS